MKSVLSPIDGPVKPESRQPVRSSNEHGSGTAFEDAVTCLVSAWLLGGLVLDGWAHQFRPGLETFFTPWHAVLYAGFTATALWTLLTHHRRRLRGVAHTGYEAGLWGAIVFGIGGFLDGLWYTLIGIEVSIAALNSPPHLIMFLGAILLVTSPWRSATRSGFVASPGDKASACVSLATAIGLTGFF